MSGQIRVQVVPITEAVYAFGSVTSSYTIALTDTHQKVWIQVVNNTDVVIFVSLNGTNNHYKLNPNVTQTIPLGDYGKFHASNVWVKDDGVAASIGEVLVFASA